MWSRAPRRPARIRLTSYCLFSSNDETGFTEAFADQRVYLKRGVQPRRDVHFKIIDGRKGYVSAHPPGAFERRYRSYDCSKVAPHIRRQRVFGYRVVTENPRDGVQFRRACADT